MQLYGHRFSAYTQKVLVALYENATPFTFRELGAEHPENGAALAALWPFRRFPVLVDEARTVVESTIIIEYLDLRRPGPVRLIPEDARAALDTRMMDRFFDNYVMTPTQTIVGDHLRPADQRDPYGVERARAMLDTAYGWLEATLAGRTWAAGGAFGLGDCAAAPSLFYADWVHPIGAGLPNVRAYRQRLLARPSFARAVDEARPYRHLFPPGAPERD
jgi:glutathione S-transferase